MGKGCFQAVREAEVREQTWPAVGTREEKRDRDP